MKSNLLALFLVLTITAEAFAGWSIEVPEIKIKVTLPKGPKVKVKVPKVIEDAGRGAGKFVEEAGKTPGNIARETENGVHDAGKALGDGVKDIRDSIATMQGVNIKKILRKIRKQIRLCRSNTKKLNLINGDLDTLKKYVQKIIKDNPEMSLEELNKKIQAKTDAMERLNNNLNVPLAASALTCSLGATALWTKASLTGAALTSSSTATATWAAYGGAYTLIAAAVIVQMSNSAVREIEHEADKLKACGQRYEKAFNRVNQTYADYVKTLAKDKTMIDGAKLLFDEFNELKLKYISYQNDVDDNITFSDITLAKEAFLKKVDRFISLYPKAIDPSEVEELKNEIAAMESL